MDSAATADYFIGIAQQALWVLALASAPILLPALAAGLILGMIQAATSMMLSDFTRDMYARIPEIVQ